MAFSYHLIYRHTASCLLGVGAVAGAVAVGWGFQTQRSHRFSSNPREAGDERVNREIDVQSFARVPEGNLLAFLGGGSLYMYFMVRSPWRSTKEVASRWNFFVHPCVLVRYKVKNFDSRSWCARTNRQGGFEPGN
jgi:hypothetical protein